MVQKIQWITDSVNFFCLGGVALNPIGTELFAKKFKDSWKLPQNSLGTVIQEVYSPHPETIECI